MSTIHNPVNFEPRDYKVIGYIDNQPPPFYHSNALAWQKAMDNWREDIKRLNVSGSLHRCCHCGNGTVRYITICTHKPSGTNVVFGTDCTERLSFEGASSFKAAHIRTHAANMAAAFARKEKREKVLAENPGLAEALASTTNSFIMNVAIRFEQYGELSERQIASVISANARDIEYAARKAAEKASAGPVPTGKRIEFTGVLVSRKQQDSQFGVVTKCLIRLDNGSKIWMTEPAACVASIGDRCTFRATVEASKDDLSFGFGNRPHFISAETPSK